MTQFSGLAIPSALPRRFALQWILGNAIGYGAGMGLPFLFADPASIESYINCGIIAFFTFGVWTGLIQWLMLRQVLPVSPLWILAAASAPIVSVFPAIALASVSLSAFLLIFVVYLLLVSLMQWLLLRRLLRPAWEWMVASLVAIFVGAAVGSMLFTIFDLFLDWHLGSFVIFSALTYGGIYGAITYVGLRPVTKLDRRLSTPAAQSVEVDSLAAPLWKMTLLSSSVLLLLIGVWVAVMPPLSETVIQRIRAASPLWGLGVGLVGVFGYSYLMILVHELGHLLLALAYGFDLRAFAVGRWIFIRHSKQWKLCRSRKRFAGGFVLPVPKSFVAFDKRSLMMMIAGGSMATFLLFVVGVLPVFLIPTTVSNSLVLWSVAVLSIISLHSVILNILPLTLGHVRTDGRRFLDLMKDDVPGQSFFALYGIDASLRQGIRPRDIDLGLIEKVLAAPETSMVRADGLFTAYTAAMDKGQLEQAETYLEQVLDNQRYMPELFRGKGFLEGAYFEAIVRGRADVARQWFEKIQDTTFIAPAALCRVEAALLLAEGKNQAALAKAEEGMVSVARDRFMKGSAVAEEDYLQALIQKIDKK